MLPLDQDLAGLMFAGMIAFLFFGFPVALSLIFTGLFFGMTGAALGVLQLNFFEILPLRIWGTMTNFTLLAVPLFVFMGVALEKSGLAEERVETRGILFGALRGGRHSGGLGRVPLHRGLPAGLLVGGAIHPLSVPPRTVEAAPGAADPE